MGNIPNFVGTPTWAFCLFWAIHLVDMGNKYFMGPSDLWAVAFWTTVTAIISIIWAIKLLGARRFMGKY